MTSPAGRAPVPARVTRALAARHRAEFQLDQARAELHAAVADAIRAGVTHAGLSQVTGYSLEHIRRIARDAGIPAA